MYYRPSEVKVTTYDKQNKPVRTNTPTRHHPAEENLFDYEWKESEKIRGRMLYRGGKYMIEITIHTDSISQRKMKIWKMYWDEKSQDWRHTKQGIILPYESGVDFIECIKEGLEF